MGFLNYRGGQKQDNFEEISRAAKLAEEREQEALGSMRRRRVAADYFGVSDLAEKDNKVVLANLQQQHRNLCDIHDSLCRNNALTSYFDDKQLMSDFWFASISEIMNQGEISDVQKVKALGLMQAVFNVENKTPAKEHFLYLQRNEAYQNYIGRCFGLSGMAMPMFWLWIQHLGNQPLGDEGQHGRNRMDTAVHFLQEYVSFMMTLSFYLSQIFPGQGCGKNTRDALNGKLEALSAEMTRQDFLQIDLSLLVNPVHFNPEDFRSDYNGFEQNENQSQGLKGVFDSLKKKFGKQNRVLQLAQLLDSCTENGSHVLENEYKRMTKGF